MGRPKYTNNSLHGLLVIDKPLGWSSMDVCRRVRRAAGNCKVGHAGTLDPLATGVVVCCLGKATKQADQLMGLTKVYETEIDLSAFTNTDDREGEREEIHVETPPTRAVIESALQKFKGDVEQTPPAYSAIHVNGHRAYKLARKGEEVDIPTRIVRIDSIDLLDYDWPTLRLRITCGKGTYIRTIARDLGKALNIGGHLASLRRTAVGDYTLAMAANERRLEQTIGEADLVQPIPVIPIIGRDSPIDWAIRSERSRACEPALKLMRAQRYVEAIEVFKLIAANSSENAWFSTFMIGAIYEVELNDPESALPFATQAAKEKPSNELASLTLVLCLFDLSRKNEGDAEIRRYVSVGKKFENYQLLFDEQNLNIDDFR